MNTNSRDEEQAWSSSLESEGEGLENEGDAHWIAARHDNEMPRELVAPGKVVEAASEAKKAIEEPEGDEPRRAAEIENQ